MGSGFNTLQAEISIGSGKIFGKGLTHGTQTQLDYLRTQTTDYIFSVLGEELGFVGVVILFALFIVLLMRRPADGGVLARPLRTSAGDGNLHLHPVPGVHQRRRQHPARCQ